MQIDHRPATHADLKPLYEIYMQPAVLRQMGFDAMPIKEFSAVLESFRQQSDFSVVERDGQVIAAYKLVRLHSRMAHVASVESFVVHPDQHGQGIGTYMVERIVAWAESHSISRLQLTVAADNLRGIAFWIASGFSVEGRYRNFFKRSGEDTTIDEIPMARLLNEASSNSEAGLLDTTTIDPYSWGAQCLGWRLVDQPGLSITLEHMPPGTHETKHLHNAARQLFFVISGKLSIQLEDRVIDLHSEQGFEIQPGIVHQVNCPGPAESRFLVISSPWTRDDRRDLVTEPV